MSELKTSADAAFERWCNEPEQFHMRLFSDVTRGNARLCYLAGRKEAAARCMVIAMEAGAEAEFEGDINGGKLAAARIREEFSL